MSYLSRFYQKEFKSVQQLHPGLKPEFINGLWQMKGSLDVIDEFGKNWDTYHVKVIFPNNYPKAIPTMYEIGGKIPQKGSYLVNSDGTCCLAVPALEMILLSRGINIKNFITELAIPYLANQTYKRKKGKFAGEEFEHGIQGLYDFYSETFQSKDPILIVKSIQKIILNELPDRNKPCYCGSNKKYKHCHQSAVQYLSPVSKEVLLNDYRLLFRAIENAVEANK